MAYDMIVPSSRHTLFMRGFRGETDMDKIRDYFSKEGGRCTFDFFKHSDDRSSLCVALRFDSKEVAKEIMSKFDNTVVLGSKIYITWFKDHRRARAKAEESWRSGHGRRYNTQSRSRYSNWRRRRNRSSSRSSSRSRSRSRNRSRSNTRSNTWSRSKSRSQERSISHDGKDHDNSPDTKGNRRQSYEKSPDPDRSGSRYRSSKDEDKQYAEGRDRSPRDRRSESYDQNNRERYRSPEGSPAGQDRRYGENFTKYEDPLANSRWADDKSASNSPSPRRSTSRDRLSPDSRKQRIQKYDEKVSPERGSDRKSSFEASKRSSRYEEYERGHVEDDVHERRVMVGKPAMRSRSPQNDSQSADREAKRSSPRRRSQNPGNWDSSPEMENLASYPPKASSRQADPDKPMEPGFRQLSRSDDQAQRIGGAINMTLKSSKSSLQKSALEGSDSDRDADTSPGQKNQRERRSSSGRRDEGESGEKTHIDVDRGDAVNNKGKSLFEKYKASMRMSASSQSKKEALRMAEERVENERKRSSRDDGDNEERREDMDTSSRGKRRREHQDEEYGNDYNEYEQERSKEPGSSKSSGGKSKRRSRELSESSQSSEIVGKIHHVHADQRASKTDQDRNSLPESNPTRMTFDLSQLGLDPSLWKKVQDKKHKVEKAYRQDCETFATVVKMLISKDPSLEDKLQHSLKENLEEIGQRCIHEMKAFIEQCKKDAAV